MQKTYFTRSFWRYICSDVGTGDDNKFAVFSQKKDAELERSGQYDPGYIKARYFFT